MADQHPKPWTMTVPREAVAQSASGAYLAITESGAGGADSALPREIAALFAPPVVVSAAPVRVPTAVPTAVVALPAAVAVPATVAVPTALPTAKLNLAVDGQRVAPAPPRPARRRAVVAPR